MRYGIYAGRLTVAICAACTLLGFAAYGMSDTITGGARVASHTHHRRMVENLNSAACEAKAMTEASLAKIENENTRKYVRRGAYEHISRQTQTGIAEVGNPEDSLRRASSTGSAVGEENSAQRTERNVDEAPILAYGQKHKVARTAT